MDTQSGHGEALPEPSSGDAMPALSSNPRTTIASGPDRAVCTTTISSSVGNPLNSCIVLLLHNSAALIMCSMELAERTVPSQAEIDDESRRLRRLRLVVQLSLSLIAEGGVSFAEAQELAASTRRLAEYLFPGKGDVYDLLYHPQFRRLMSAVYRLH